MLEVSIAGDSDIDDIVVMPLEEIACSDSLIDLVLRFSPVVTYQVLQTEAATTDGRAELKE